MTSGQLLLAVLAVVLAAGSLLQTARATSVMSLGLGAMSSFLLLGPVVFLCAWYASASWQVAVLARLAHGLALHVLSRTTSIRIGRQLAPITLRKLLPRALMISATLLVCWLGDPYWLRFLVVLGAANVIYDFFTQPFPGIVRDYAAGTQTKVVLAAAFGLAVLVGLSELVWRYAGFDAWMWFYAFLGLFAIVIVMPGVGSMLVTGSNSSRSTHHQN